GVPRQPGPDPRPAGGGNLPGLPAQPGRAAPQRLGGAALRGAVRPSAQRPGAEASGPGGDAGLGGRPGGLRRADGGPAETHPGRDAAGRSGSLGAGWAAALPHRGAPLRRRRQADPAHAGRGPGRTLDFRSGMAKGSLTVISGPMFSNKSGELIRLATVHRIAGRRVGLFKHSLDDRYEGVERISTHAGLSAEAEPVGSSASIGLLATSYDVVAVDEAQFYD